MHDFAAGIANWSVLERCGDIHAPYNHSHGAVTCVPDLPCTSSFSTACASMAKQRQGCTRTATQHPLLGRYVACPAASAAHAATHSGTWQCAHAGKDKEPIRSVPTSVKEAPSIGGKSSADAEQDAPLRVSLNKPGVPSGSPDNSMQVAWRRLLKEFSSLPRAIAIMFAIAGLSGLGTIIPQNKAGVAAASVPDTAHLTHQRKLPQLYARQAYAYCTALQLQKHLHSPHLTLVPPCVFPILGSPAAAQTLVALTPPHPLPRCFPP